MRELVTPDLDLIKQAKQGVWALGKADPVALWRVDKTVTNAGGLLLICCRSNKTKPPIKRMSDFRASWLGRGPAEDHPSQSFKNETYPF